MGSPAGYFGPNLHPAEDGVLQTGPRP